MNLPQTLGIQDLEMVKQKWLFRYVERSTGWIAEARNLNVFAHERHGMDDVLVGDRKKLEIQ